jgi:hypothetical protein
MVSAILSITNFSISHAIDDDVLTNECELSPISGLSASLRVCLPMFPPVIHHPGECNSIRRPFLNFRMHMMLKLILQLL